MIFSSSESIKQDLGRANTYCCSECLSELARNKNATKKIMLDYLADNLKASEGISCSPRRTLSPVRSRALKVRIVLKITYM